MVAALTMWPRMGHAALGLLALALLVLSCTARKLPNAVETSVADEGADKAQAWWETVQRERPSKLMYIPRSASTFDEFLLELREALSAHQLPTRPVQWLFGAGSHVLHCQGDWLEFGVATGGTLTMAADWRRGHCGAKSPPVHGFDTFTGLPEAWDHGGVSTIKFKPGDFSLGGKFPHVPNNTVLHKGLFSETLPGFIKEQEQEEHRAGATEESAPLTSGAGKGTEVSVHTTSHNLHAHLHAHLHVGGHQGHPVARHPWGDPTTIPFKGASYIHIDCDLYQGSIEALTLLNHRMHRGTVLVFDDLINYPAYREHEVKALWEWLVASGRSLRVVGAAGARVYDPAADKDEAMVLDPPNTFGLERQSAIFIVA